MKTKKKMTEQMREIRNQVSVEIMNMSLEEEKAYLQRRLQALKNERLTTANKQ